VSPGSAPAGSTGTGMTGAFVRAGARELIWGLRLVSREVNRWRERAVAIPDPELRADALAALANKRGNINGAALFWTLPQRRNRHLLSVLVAYEILADYVDCVNERGAERGVANGLQLQRALVDAVDLDAEISDYYREHHCHEDSGYLNALVQNCRASCRSLPSYESMRPLITSAAGLTPVLALNHEPDPELRDRALEEWVGKEWPEIETPALPAALVSGGRPQPAAELTWFERSAGASAWLTVLAMLALAAEPRRTAPAAQEAQQVYETYLSWIAPAGAMLDSYGDIAEDVASHHHSYVGHYPSTAVAVQRVSELVRGCRREARALPHGSRHALLSGCMIAFYLSKDSVSTRGMRASTRRLAGPGGPLVAMLLPVLRLWRTAYGQRSA
jgi:tetraprenyl-beta-curcumene synthase